MEPCLLLEMVCDCCGDATGAASTKVGGEKLKRAMVRASRTADVIMFEEFFVLNSVFYLWTNRVSCLCDITGN